MNEHEVDRILMEIGQEQYTPSPELVEQTRIRMRRNPWLPILVAVGIGLQLLTLATVQVYLLFANVSPVLRIFGQAGMATIAITVILLILTARGRVLFLLHRFEAAAGCR